MKESFEKNMTRSRLKRAGDVVEWEMKTWQAIRRPESGGK